MMFTHNNASPYRTLILALSACALLCSFVLHAQQGRGGRSSIDPRPAVGVPIVTDSRRIGAILTGSAGASVQAVFDLDTPGRSPFPSDRFTAADLTNNTGLRVNVPKPNCLIQPSDCADLDVINTLDGFSVQPRLSIPFSGFIDVTTVNSRTIFLLSLGSTLPDGDPGGSVVGINEVVWDPATLTLHAWSDELLEQHTRYALIVTSTVRDEMGEPVKDPETFRQFLATEDGEYRKELLRALAAAEEMGIPPDQIAVASVFTTQSVTSVLEKIRGQIDSETPAQADFRLGPQGTRAVFHLDQIKSITFNQQTGDNPPRFTPAAVQLSLLNEFSPGVVGQIAFGKYVSPDYRVHPGEYIPAIGTLTGTPVVQVSNEIYFNLFLPSGPKPAAGWPVAIMGHGGQGSKEVNPYSFIGSLASRGIATIAINAPGRGGGVQGTLAVEQAQGDTVMLPSGGRGFDQNRDGIIGTDEGAAATAPQEILGQRDAFRQQVVDWMQLVRVIEGGIDVDGDGAADLDASRIYFYGASFGGGLGIEFLAIEPRVRVGVFSYPAASTGRNDLNRLLPSGGITGRSSVGKALAARTPPLLNTYGLTSLGGVTLVPPYFNENIPLRNHPPVINDVSGAMEIQEVFERTAWVSQSADVAALAPYVRRHPLPGSLPKAVLIQFGKGDQTAPNPRTTEILRAADLADRTTYYRHDLAYAEDPTLRKDAHGFAAASPTEIARGAQTQMAAFLASDGVETIWPEPSRFFEVPIVLPLPEELNFIP